MVDYYYKSHVRTCEDIIKILKGRGLKPSALKLSKGKKCEISSIKLNHKGLQEDCKTIHRCPSRLIPFILNLKSGYCYDFSGGQMQYAYSLEDLLFCLNGIVRMNVG